MADKEPLHYDGLTLPEFTEMVPLKSVITVSPGLAEAELGTLDNVARSLQIAQVFPKWPRLN